MLLAQPLSRLRYLMTHTLVTVVGILVISLAAHLGTEAGLQTAKIKLPAPTRQFRVPFFGMNIGATEDESFRYVPISGYVAGAPFWLAATNYASLGAFLMGLSTAMSAWDRYRWRTIGIVVGFYIVETVIELTGMAVEGWGWILNLTFFSAYEPVSFVIDATQQPDFAWRFVDPEAAGVLPDLAPLGCICLLAGLGALGLAIGTVIFCRRDIPAPL